MIFSRNGCAEEKTWWTSRRYITLYPYLSFFSGDKIVFICSLICILPYGDIIFTSIQHCYLRLFYGDTIFVSVPLFTSFSMVITYSLPYPCFFFSFGIPRLLLYPCLFFYVVHIFTFATSFFFSMMIPCLSAIVITNLFLYLCLSPLYGVYIFTSVLLLFLH